MLYGLCFSGVASDNERDRVFLLGITVRDLCVKFKMVLILLLTNGNYRSVDVLLP